MDVETGFIIAGVVSGMGLIGFYSLNIWRIKEGKHPWLCCGLFNPPEQQYHAPSQQNNTPQPPWPQTSPPQPPWQPQRQSAPPTAPPWPQQPPPPGAPPQQQPPPPPQWPQQPPGAPPQQPQQRKWWIPGRATAPQQSQPPQGPPPQGPPPQQQQQLPGPPQGQSQIPSPFPANIAQPIHQGHRPQQFQQQFHHG